MPREKRILLIVSGGIAAYKALEAIRLLKDNGFKTRIILTKNGGEFVTPLSLSALSEDKVFQDLFSLTDENEMGHIELSRNTDLVLVAPATANIIAKMAAGIADDLATTTLLATDKPILIAPSMNVRMWQHPATKENVATLISRGIHMVDPEEGDMACGEYGFGRMADPEIITKRVCHLFQIIHNKNISNQELSLDNLCGKKAIITSGPTRELIDPARYITNQSSGRQGHAIASALAEFGADTTLISGPTQLEDPVGVKIKKVTSAKEMLRACKSELPADILVCAAAVADWQVEAQANNKIKKSGKTITLELSENPDILGVISKMKTNRPSLVIGFAAETNSVIKNGLKKLDSKGCDWIVANNVSPKSGVFGGLENTVHIIDHKGIEDWPKMSKVAIGQLLVERITNHFASE